STALYQAKFVAQAAVDQASARLQANRATRQASEQNIRVAEHQLAAARATLAQASHLASGGPEANVVIASPVTGRVLGVGHESEGSVQAGQAMLEVGNPESLEVLVELLSTSAVKLAPGSRVRLDRWGGEQPLEAVVRVVEPAGFTKVSALGVEEQRVRVLCDLTTPRGQWRQLGDGYRVEASFVLWQGDDLVLAPTSALFRHGDGWAVFVMDAGRARLRPVRVGQRNGTSAQILSGLKVGETVVMRPDDRIKEGVRVAPRQPG
ncbi:MAG: HlyD family efflux transporter periplasmic adaptor subunit, partial [Gallionellaceae bacterium]|nr:HlyD family efflux transporter periplasmic adaptor subunit [Gallionellaceae bacterium]